MRTKPHTKCTVAVSSEKSGWGSTTAGTIVHRGKTYYARVYPARVSLSRGG